MNAYAGIGSRKITDQERKIIKFLAGILSPDYVCYSGNANGSDIAFQEGSKGNCVVFLPWQGFNMENFDYKNESIRADYFVTGSFTEGVKSVNKYHPNPSALTAVAVKLMARNYYQIHGIYKYPQVDFVLCCADQDSDDNVLGGTGQACRIAKSLNIPIINIRYLTGVDKILDRIEEIQSLKIF